jgi:hypothetical protein
MMGKGNKEKKGNENEKMRKQGGATFNIVSLVEHLVTKSSLRYGYSDLFAEKSSVVWQDILFTKLLHYYIAEWAGECESISSVWVALVWVSEGWKEWALVGKWVMEVDADSGDGQVGVGWGNIGGGMGSGRPLLKKNPLPLLLWAQLCPWTHLAWLFVLLKILHLQLLH